MEDRHYRPTLQGHVVYRDLSPLYQTAAAHQELRGSESKRRTLTGEVLLHKYLVAKSKIVRTLANLVHFMRINLFSRIELGHWEAFLSRTKIHHWVGLCMRLVLISPFQTLTPSPMVKAALADYLGQACIRPHVFFRSVSPHHHGALWTFTTVRVSRRSYQKAQCTHRAAFAT